MWITASDPPAPRWPLEAAFAVALGVGLVVACAGWTFLQVTPEQTAARRVRWSGGEPERPCDPRFGGLIADGRVWLRCGSALVRIDPSRGTGDLRWPLPAAFGSPLDVVAVSAGPHGLIAFVVRMHGGLLIAGVAGELGWDVAPQVVGGDHVGAIRWDGDVAEIGTLPTPAVTRLGGDTRALSGGEALDLWVDDLDRWIWHATSGDLFGRPTPAARGVVAPSVEQVAHYPAGVDLVTEVQHAGPWLARQGGVVPAPATWRAEVERSDRAPWPLDVARPDGAWHVVARTTATTDPIVIEHSDRFHVVFADGSYASVGPDLARLDPPSLEQHLGDQTWRARLVQLGLPLALLVALAIARIRARPPTRAMAVASLTYAVAATLCLVRLAPLL